MSTKPVGQEPYVPPLAGATAIVPLYYLFARKAARQLERPLPAIILRDLAVGGIKLAPTAGVIVGIQVELEGRVKECVFNGQQDLSATAGSAAIVGAASVAPLAILNGQTMGRTPWQSVCNLSIKQAGACVARETLFLTGLISSDAMAKYMQARYGESKALAYAAAFFGGSVGSVAGHPFDTLLTRWQGGLPTTIFRQLWAGAPSKALACGLFSVGFKAVKEMLS